MPLNVREILRQGSLAIVYTLKNYPRNLPILLFTLLLGVPYLIRLIMYGKTSWHAYLKSTCITFQILSVLPMIESTLFLNPEIIEHKVGTFLTNTNGKLYVDVGACAGRYVILLGEKYRNVIAIEPEPHNMHRLRLNVKWAGLTNVQFLQCAVADQDGYANFYLGLRPDNHSLVYRLNKRKGVLSTRRSVVTPILMLPSILKDRSVDLIKVDVEGVELSVLKGAEPIIMNIKRWIVELHDEDKRTTLEEWFLSHHYTICWLDRNHIYAWRNV